MRTGVHAHRAGMTRHAFAEVTGHGQAGLAPSVRVRGGHMNVTEWTMMGAQTAANTVILDDDR